MKKSNWKETVKKILEGALYFVVLPNLIMYEIKLLVRYYKEYADFLDKR